jgi:hypothetical protein
MESRVDSSLKMSLVILYVLVIKLMQSRRSEYEDRLHSVGLVIGMKVLTHHVIISMSQFPSVYRPQFSLTLVDKI